ncbi:T9SS type A sorting domain-containing protein [Flammeovirga kamogawensis]|uniref:T9SS type A sorting domain-containing protein n=1 Tax=Flammeovirga kamogawensis TaxID=373891 RepID=A0ABX8H470_9BACT|nr:T9SS type A sorting domain-containing protein [Flammeovirga kamogawensis]MBB6460407.1 hypothetical protein [Flammeovirga kamogawensis]QWG10212.1 T9SS type A sorting domain-containing protein [Flammeovirga kamogawensis]TRX64665.1 T9SS type A sorting domain-containing protein [Flammeovirga kamogawensis]
MNNFLPIKNRFELLCILLLLFMVQHNVFAQNTYYSKSDGSFTDLTIWEDLSNNTPTAILSTDTYIIQKENSVTVPSNILLTSLEVEGTLIVNENVAITLHRDYYYYGTAIWNIGSSLNLEGNLPSILEGRNSNGSSKTILLNSLILNKSGARTKVIVNNSRLDIEDKLSVVNTTFEPKDEIAIAGDFSVDNQSYFGVEKGVFINFDGNDQLVTIPEAINKLIGNEFVKFSNVRFTNNGTKIVSGDLNLDGELQVLHELDTDVEINEGTHHINSIKISDDKADTDNDAIEFDNSNLYINGTIYHYHTIDETITGNIDLGDVSIYAVNGNLTIGDDKSNGDEVYIDNDVFINNGKTLLSRVNSLLNSRGDLYVHGNSKVIVEGDNFPVFDNFELKDQSTFVYQSINDQSVKSNITYVNLTLLNPSNKYINGDIIINGNLSIYDGANLQLSSGKDIELHGSLNNRKDTDVTEPGLLSASNGSITLINENKNQYINKAKGSIYYTIGTLNIKSNGALTENRTVNILNPLTVGTINIENQNGASSNMLNANFATTDISLSSNLLLNAFTRVRTASSNPSYLSKGLFNATSYVTFDGAVTQKIPAINYSNLEFNGNGKKVFQGTTYITGDFVKVGGENTLDITNKTLFVGGDWRYNVESGYTGSTVNLNGTVEQNIYNSKFNHLIVSGAENTNFIKQLYIEGDLSLVGASVTAFAKLFVYGNWTEDTNSSFTQTKENVEFVGSSDQIVTTNASSKFNNVVLNGIGKTVFKEDTFIDGFINLTSGRGNVDFEKNLTLGGGFTNSGTGSTVTQSGIFYFVGTQRQEIRVDNANYGAFGKVEFSGEGLKVFSGNSKYTFLDDFVINNATVDGGNKLFYVSGNWVNNNGEFKSGGTVFFNGGTAQTVDASTFNNLTLEGVGTSVSLNDNIIVKDLRLNSSTSLSLNNKTIGLSGNWYGNDGTFIHENGTVIFTGNNATVYSNDKFYNFTLNLGEDNTLFISNTDDASQNFEIENDFSIKSGRLESRKRNLFVGGNYDVNGDIRNITSLTLNASNAGNYIFKPGIDFQNSGLPSKYYNTQINISPAAGVVYNLEGDLRMEASSGTLALQSGTLDANGHLIELTNENKSIIVSSTATLELDAGSVLQLPNNTSGALIVENGATLLLEGDENSYAIIEGNGVNDNFDIQIAGVLSATNYKLSDLGGNGLQFKSGASLNTTYNLSDGIFAGGNGNASVTIEDGVNLSTQTIKNVVFNNGPSVAVTNNDSKSGVITFFNASGSNATVENDVYNKIEWADDNNFIVWTGATNTTWNLASNWSTSTIPTATDNVKIPSSGITNYPIVTSSVEVGKVLIENSATLTLSDRFTVNNGININSGGTLIGGDNGSIQDSIIVNGDWINEGAFTKNQSIIKFIADDASIKSFIPGSSEYATIVIDVNEATVLHSSNTLKVDNFILSSGSYDVSDKNIEVNTSWNKNGGYFNYRKATVVSDNATIYGGEFFNLQVKDGSTLTLEGNITVNNTIKLNSSSSTFTANNNLIYLLGEFDNREGGTFTQDATGTIILNGATQSLRGDLTFGNLIIQGTGNKFIRDGANISILQDLTILNGIGTVYLEENSTLVGSGIFTMTGGQMIIRDTDNYPKNFAQYQITGGTFSYYSSVAKAQNIAALNYYNLVVNNGEKTLLGDITISRELKVGTGSLSSTLNVAGFQITLGGNITSNTSNNPILINWDNGTLIHNGGGWAFNQNVTTYHHLILGGSGWKRIQSDISITGDFTVKDNVIFEQGNTTKAYQVTGTATGEFFLEDGSIYRAFAEAGNVAFVNSFSDYHFDANSIVEVKSEGDADIFISTIPQYGILKLYASGDVTLTSDNSLRVVGEFKEELKSDGKLIDNGQDLYIGGRYQITNYENPTSKIVFNGDEQQDIIGSGVLYFNDLSITGNGLKKLYWGNTIEIKGDVALSGNTEFNTNKKILFTGGDWTATDDATFISSNQVVVGKNEVFDQSLNFGNNTIKELIFIESSTKTINCNLNVDTEFVIEDGAQGYGNASGIIDFSNFTHSVGVERIYTVNGSYVAQNANFIFDGGNQYIPADFEVNNFTLNGSTKYLLGNLSAKTVKAINNARLETNVASEINVKGNWDFKEGYFTTNEAYVNFIADQVGIYTIHNRNNNTMYSANFNATALAEYQLENNLYTKKSSVINGNSLLDVNGYILYIGNRSSADEIADNVEGITIYGTLEISNGGALRVNARDTKDGENPTDPTTLPYVYVENGGYLKIVGAEGQLSRLSAEDKKSDNHRLDVKIKSGGKIAAKFYEFKNLDHSGLYVDENATLDPEDQGLNFSEGVWSGMSTNRALVRYYLEMNANAPSTEITNVTFDYNNTPFQGEVFNVKRINTANELIFGGSTGIAGSIKGETYEDDSNNNITWPPNTTITWEGDISSDWFTADNWDLNIIPSGIHNVVVNSKSKAGTYYPIINGSAKAICRDLIITGGQLTLDGDFNGTTDTELQIGGDVLIESGLLLVNGSEVVDVNENWSVSSNGSFESGNGQINFLKESGTIVLDQANSPFNNLEISGNAVVSLQSKLEVDGHFSITQNGGISFPVNYEVIFNGDITLSENASFDTVTEGWVYLNGTSTQNLKNTRFGKAKFGGEGPFIVSDSLITYSEVHLNKGVFETTDITSSLSFKNRVLIDNDAFSFNLFDGSIHYMTGDRWIASGTVNNYSGVNTFVFNSPTGTTIIGDHAYFSTIQLDMPTTALTLNSDITVGGDFDASVGNVNLSTYSINGTASSQFLLGENKSMYINGSNNFPKGFDLYDFNKNSTVEYKGGIGQTITTSSVTGKPVFYGNISCSAKGSVKTLNGNLTALGNITIRDATLDISDNNYRITVGGNFDNQTVGGVFLYRQGVLVLNGTGQQQVRQLASKDNRYYDLVIDNSSSTEVVQIRESDITIEGNLVVQQGTLNIDNRVATLEGSLLVTNGHIAESGNYYFKTSGISALIQTNSSKFRGLVLDGLESTEYIVKDDIIIADGYDLEFKNGILSSADASITLGNNSHFNIYNTASYAVGAGGNLMLGNNATVNVLGDIQIIGAENSTANVKSSQSGWYYNFNVDGTIGAKNYEISGMASTGIYIKENATIDVNNNFSEGSFLNYFANGVGLRIENTQDFIATFDGSGNYVSGAIEKVNFIQNAVNGVGNVSKLTSSTGQIDFYAAQGQLSGSNFERDPNGLINWYAPNPFTWIGAEDNDWFNAANWSSNLGGIPSENDDVYIIATTNQPIIDGTATAKANNLFLEVGTLLQINSSTTASDLVVTNSVVLNGQLTMNSENDKVEFGENWIINPTGSFSHGNGHLITNGTGAQTIDNAGVDFGYLSAEGTSNVTLLLRGNENITNDFTVNGGEFILSGFEKTVIIKGNISVSNGVLTPNLNTLLLAGNSNQTIDIASETVLHNLEIDVDPTITVKVISDQLKVKNNINVLNGILDLNGKELYFGGNAGSLFTLSGGLLSDNTTIFMGDAASFNQLAGESSFKNSRITHQNNGYYSFVLKGGKINTAFTTFEYMDDEGVVLDGVTIIAETEGASKVVFPNTIFQYGEGTYLNIKQFITEGVGTVDYINGENIEGKFYNISINSGGTYNVRNQSGSALYFIDSKGALIGDDYEDPISTADINWQFTRNIYTYNGPAKGAWENKDHWILNGGVAVNYPGELAEHADNAIVIIPTNTATTISADANLKVYSVAIAPKAGFVIIGDGDDDIYELEITDLFLIASNGTESGFVDFEDALVKVKGRIDNQGIFTPNNSKMVLEPSGNINLVAGENYNNLLIQPTTDVQITLGGNATITGDFEVKKGTLVCNDYTLSIGGDVKIATDVVLDSDEFTIELNGEGNQTIEVDNHAFANLLISGNGTKQLASDLTINGNLQVTSFDGNLDAGNYNIILKGNWENEYGGAFIPGTGTVTFSGNDVQIIGFGAEETFYNLVVNNTNGLISNRDFSIENNLTLTNGIVKIPHLTLNEAVGEITSSASAYVAGKVTKIQLDHTLGGLDGFYIFPVGSTSTYARAAINVPDGTETADFSVEFFESNPEEVTEDNDSDLFISKIASWDIHRENNSVFTNGVFIRLYFENPDQYFSITDENKSSLRIAHFNSINIWEEVQADWIAESGSSAYYLESNTQGEVNDFSIYAPASLEESVIPSALPEDDLPVELTFFNANVDDGGNVAITWETASEFNSSYFELEKSTDGVHYSVIEKVKAVGTSAISIQYEASDIMTSSIAYYRLVQVDIDNTYEVFEPVMVTYKSDEFNNLSVIAYPNPMTKDNLMLEIGGLENKEHFKAQIVTINGKLITTLEGVANSSGYATHTVDVSDLNTGLYICKVKTASGKSIFLKLVK